MTDLAPRPGGWGSYSSPAPAPDRPAQHHPEAVSFAAGRPFEGFLDPGLTEQYLRSYRRRLADRLADASAVRLSVPQYGRAMGIIHELVAEHLWADEGIAVDPDAVVVTAGCQEARYLTLRALRRTDRDVLLAVAPSYRGLDAAARLAELRVLPVRDAAAGLDLADLVAQVRRARAEGLRPRACYLVPDCVNPAGAVLDGAARLELLRLADEHDFLLIEDSPYELVGDRDGTGPAALKALDGHRRVIHLGSFARAGAPGARVGYAVADQCPAEPATGRPEPLAELLRRIKRAVTVDTAPSAQAVIGGKLLHHNFRLRAARQGETRARQDNLRLLRQGLTDRFAGTTGIGWQIPDGGFLCRLDVPFAAGEELLAHCARTHRVLWTPVHPFYAGAEPRPQLRLSVGRLEQEELLEGLDRLAEFVHAQL
ncbi:PLP-dependent aminotransferase family protein [Kitasatospora sp. NPDC002227]|uniref:PLP-dependent aminotransferase family protein n=1 Tax=Kitasatospora sp. NPDC002227 TaxID=3154773 RepID=UPI00332CFCE1